MAATAPKYNILVDQAIWGIPPQDMPLFLVDRLEWYRQALNLLTMMPKENSVSWKAEDICGAQERTQERIDILERLIKKQTTKAAGK